VQTTDACVTYHRSYEKSVAPRVQNDGDTFATTGDTSLPNNKIKG